MLVITIITIIIINMTSYFGKSYDKLIDLENNLDKNLLHDHIYTLTAKTIKKICVKGNQSITIKRSTGLNIIVESNNLMLCKIKDNTLYIEEYHESSWMCCKFNIWQSSSTSSSYSKIWHINAFIIVNTIDCKGSCVFIMSEGFDKSLSCSNNNGLILITNLNVVNLNCKAHGSGKIKITNSYCSNFVGEVFDNGYIKTPKVSSSFVCKIEGKGKIDGLKHNKCILNKKISKNGKFEMIDL